MKRLVDFLRPTQEQLFSRLRRHFKGQSLVSKGNFILVHGQAPVMLVAHLDTVHEQPVRDICSSDNGNVLSSPQGIGGDDRCGVFAIVKVHRLSAVKPWLLFCCDEEVGGLGADRFCLALEQELLPAQLHDLKCIVEIDRRGFDDAVFYDCANPDFEAYINGKGFKTAFGSFSDISLIAPALGIAAVNLSSGYYNAHRLNEFIVLSELEHTIRRVVDIVADSARTDFPQYPYETAFNFDDSWAYDQDYLADFPPDLPVEYHEIYDELRYIYTAEELEYARQNYGNQILWQLYREEFGYSDFER